MALKDISKINCRIKFLYRKNRFLSQPLRRLLCSALIQPHFNYACSAWYPNLNNRLKSKLQILQKQMHLRLSEFKQYSPQNGKMGRTRAELIVLRTYVENQAILEPILLYRASKCKQTKEQDSEDCLCSHILPFYVIISFFSVKIQIEKDQTVL